MSLSVPRRSDPGLICFRLAEFPLQGLRLVAMDYNRTISAEDERRSEDGEYGTLRKYVNRLIRGMPMAQELEEQRRVHFGGEDREEKTAEAGTTTTTTTTRPSSPSAASTVLEREATLPLSDDGISDVAATPRKEVATTASLGTPSHPLTRRQRLLSALKSGIMHSLKPPTVSLVCSIIIGVIPVLRNLFVAAESPNSRFSPLAPDGNPPLSTIYEAASFIGAASVPLGLIVLGASIATIEFPRPSESPQKRGSEHRSARLLTCFILSLVWWSRSSHSTASRIHARDGARQACSVAGIRILLRASPRQIWNRRTGEQGFEIR